MSSVPNATIATRIRTFIDNERNREVTDRLRERGVEPRGDREGLGEELAGLAFVVTGRIENWTRDDLEDLGGGENPGTTEREDAEANDVREIGPEEFSETVEDRGVDVGR